MTRKDKFTAGFVRENPVFALYLGLCSVLAISTSLNNALGMGAAVIIVTIISNVIVSAIRKVTPSEIRIPVYIVIIATLVKIIQMVIQAYAPTLDAALGIFIPLIVVNCIILGRAEAFASKNTVLDSAIDGLGMGLGYTAGLVVLSSVRQILSTGILNLVNPFTGSEIFSLTLIPETFTISIFGDAFGAFVTFAFIAAGVAMLKARSEAKQAKEAK